MSPARQGAKIAKAIPDATLAAIPDSGHMMMVEKPDATLDALIAFSRFVDFSRFGEGTRPLDGHVFVIFVITVAAAEAAVALALVVAVYRHRQTIDVDRINVLRW